MIIIADAQNRSTKKAKQQEALGVRVALAVAIPVGVGGVAPMLLAVKNVKRIKRRRIKRTTCSPVFATQLPSLMFLWSTKNTPHISHAFK